MVTKCHKGGLLPTPSNQPQSHDPQPCLEAFHSGESRSPRGPANLPPMSLVSMQVTTQALHGIVRLRVVLPLERSGHPWGNTQATMCKTLHFMSIGCYIVAKVNDRDPRAKLSREDNTRAVLGSAQEPQLRALPRHAVGRRIGLRVVGVPARLELCLVALGCCGLPLRPQNHCSRATQTSQQ
jgi:hypothetical protein